MEITYLKIKIERNKTMKKTISILTEEFENEQTNEKVEGITIIVDGMLKDFVEIVKAKDSSYQTTVDVIQDSLMKGLDEVRKKIDKK